MSLNEKTKHVDVLQGYDCKRAKRGNEGYIIENVKKEELK